MPLIINHNMLACNAARNLGDHYSELSASTRRLSSGLRIGTAADDAAGLAIRELMRADISALNQGVRNANDAISMLQTADGALGVIDEKLIRLKELAEQAATGTYSSTQRLMIDSEFQAMISEIDRIAAATDFNGVKLLDGSLNGEHNGAGLNSSGAMKIHFGPGNNSAEDYYYISIGASDARSLLFPDILSQWPGATWQGNNIVYNVHSVVAGSNPQAVPGMTAIDSYVLPVGIKNIVINSKNSINPFIHKPHVNLFTKSGEQLTGVDPQGMDVFGTGGSGAAWWNSMTRDQVIAAGVNAGFFNSSAAYGNSIINSAGQRLSVGSMIVSMGSGQSEDNGWETIRVSEITSDLVFMIGGHNNPDGGCNVYDLEISAEIDTSINTQQR